jgi:outer membrane protein OmpA-like peptidoglycan-associated protein
VHPAVPIVVISVLVALTGKEEKPPVAEAPGTRVVLIPGADGETGAVVVRSAGGETVLDRPYAAADVGSKGTVALLEQDTASVRERFGAALDAQPPRPVSFTVYFLIGSDELTPESRQTFGEIKAELARRPVPDIVVIGHTDRVGTVEYNDKLSLVRARTVRSALVAAGIAADRIQEAGRGEREPVVPTADDVAEPRNRRVEINVR